MPIITKINPSKTKTITFYVLHLPLLLIALGVLAVTALVSSAVTPEPSRDESVEQPLGYVLGDDDDEDEDSGDDDSDDDKREDDKEDEDRDNDEDEDENEDEDSEEDVDEDDDGEDEDDNGEEESEDDDGDDNKTKTQEKIQNDDGTYSVVKTETEGDKVKVESKTYDTQGNLIKEEKHEGSDEGFESETEDSSGNKLKIRVQDTKALIKREGVTGLDNFPLYIDETDGSVYVQTPNGEVRLGMMPQSIVEKAESLEDVDSVIDVELESESDDKVEFKLKTKKAKKLFGVFEVDIPNTVYFDAQDGEQLRSEQTFITKVLDFLSF